MTASILSERRATRPFGLEGGSNALPGLNLLILQSGRVVNLGAKATTQVQGGDRLRILTPGGAQECSASDQTTLKWKQASLPLLRCAQEAVDSGPLKTMARMTHPQRRGAQNG